MRRAAPDRRFLFEYRFEGGLYAFHIGAADEAEALRRLEVMQQARLLGEVGLVAEIALPRWPARLRAAAARSWRFLRGFPDPGL